MVKNTLNGQLTLIQVHILSMMILEILCFYRHSSFRNIAVHVN